MSDKNKNEEPGLETLVQVGTSAGACCGGESCCGSDAADDVVVPLSPATEAFIIISED